MYVAVASMHEKNGIELLCHTCCCTGITDGFWEYRLKPWDCAAGVLMVQEAGGIVTTMTGGPYTVFHR